MKTAANMKERYRGAQRADDECCETAVLMRKSRFGATAARKKMSFL